MASSSQLKAELLEYYTFKERVSTFASKILEGYTSYSSTGTKIKDLYQIDDEPGDKGKIKNSYNSIKDCYDLLVNNTIPAINNKIDNLNSQIREAEAEEERRRREEEERRAEDERKALETKTSGGKKWINMK